MTKSSSSKPASVGNVPALTSGEATPVEAPKKLEFRRSSPARFRLLPLTLVMAVLMLGVKIHSLYQDGLKLRDMMVPDARAKDKDKAATQEMAATGGDAKAADKKEDAAAEGEKKEAASEEKSAEGGEKAEGEKTAEGEKPAEGEAAPDVKLAKLADQPGLAGSERKKDFSNIELDILQSLAERRDKLEERSKEVDLKEKLLEATEMRINDKINEIRSLKVEVQKLLDEYNAKEKVKVQGLVKIYENMKPKDAAQIFNELEMPILLEVIDQMGARKVAPVLANMDPLRAKDVTRELVEYRKLREIPRNVTQNQAPAPATEPTKKQ